MQKSRKDIFIIGFALFSMFFGAGNVIFPPYLGLESGPQWILGFACYYLADIGLALVTLFALLRSGGSQGITDRLGAIPSTLMMCAIILCIGPMLAIPRTAATTYEMSIAPVFPGFSSVLFSILFFSLIIALCIRQSAVVDIVGKFLTPALLIGLLILIVKGVISPIGPVASISQVESVPVNGIKAGYQTMDVLAAMVFGILILKSAHEKGHHESKAKSRVVAGAGIVAGIGLLVVYMGLTYLGATCSSLFDVSIDRSVLVVSIVKALLGQTGVIIFAIVVALACVTTAVALVSSAASYFSDLSKGKLPYGVLVVIVCVFSAVVSNIGLEEIVAIAAPVLDIVYPPALVLIILSFFSKNIKSDLVFKVATLGALITSILLAIHSYGISIPLLDKLPFASLGFAWIVPAAIFGIAGYVIAIVLNHRGGSTSNKEQGASHGEGSART